jgi:membrane protein DedA with SNARE-associated domain
VAAAVLAEGMGIPTPGQTLLITGALEAIHGRLNIAWLLFLVTTSATVGNSIGYAIGRYGGPAVLNKLKINTARIQRVENIFARRGGVLILFGRFLDGFRQLNGIIAGFMRMPWWIFTIYNIAGAVLWACIWGFGTYYLGRDIHIAANLLHHHGWALYGMTIAVLLVVLLWFLRP